MCLGANFRTTCTITFIFVYFHEFCDNMLLSWKLSTWTVSHSFPFSLKFTMIPLTPDTQLNVRLRWLRDNGRLFTVYSVLDIYTRDYCDRFNITRKPMTRCVAMFDYRSRRKRVWSIIEVNIKSIRVYNKCKCTVSKTRLIILVETLAKWFLI